jgi:hypothetical protein
MFPTRLIDNIVRGCADEGGVLIDLRGGDLIESDRSTDVATLIDLKQWHVGSPL